MSDTEIKALDVIKRPDNGQLTGTLLSNAGYQALEPTAYLTESLLFVLLATLVAVGFPR